MEKIWIILKNEFISTVFRRSFILTLILIPLGGLVVSLIVTELQKSNTTGNSNLISEIFAPSTKNFIEGYVDFSGIIKSLPKDLSTKLKAYPDENSVKQALENSEISAYYLISADYLKSGDVKAVRPDFNPMQAANQSDMIGSAISYNLLNGDQGLFNRLQTPFKQYVGNYITDQPVREQGNMLTFFIPYIVVLLFYIMILGSSSLMLNSITNEKQNRVIEILMTSVTPTQMLTGKIIALGLAGLLQTIIWSGSAFLLLRINGEAAQLPVAFQLSPTILIWGAVFFVLGYGVYSILMAGLGALVPNLKEASQTTTLIILPMMIPMFLVSVLVEDPNGIISVVLSLFPLTSPVSMMARLAGGSIIPFWQLMLSILLLVGTVIFFLKLVAGMFRAQNLLSGQKFSAKVFFGALIGRY